VAQHEDSLIQQYYKSHVNSGLYGLLSFMGLDSAEVDAEGWLVRTADGREFIDCVGGYGAYNFGHRHSRIVAAVERQLRHMPMSSKLLLNPVMAELAHKLATLLPGELSFCFFCNSGTEAVEAAIKLARLATGKPGIVSAHNAFHGKTLGSLSSTHRVQFQQPFLPLLSGFTEHTFGDIDALAAALTDEVAAVMLEPVQGEGGIIAPPAGYLKAVRDLTRERGVLLIIDEVQTGMGRTGFNFACEADGIEPDLMVLAKSLGGGVMPIGATIGTPEVWKIYQDHPLLHTSTFGGNQLACAAALEAIDVLEEEGLAARAADTGNYFIDRLRKVAAAYPDLVREVRGRGLMIGMDMVSTDASELFIASVLEQRLLVAFALNQPGVIRFEPPLIMPAQVVDDVVVRIESALDATKQMISQFAPSPAPGENS
jgi:putrescine aminotransferase